MNTNRTDETNKKNILDQKQIDFNNLETIERDFQKNTNLESECQALENQIQHLKNMLMATPGVPPTQYGAMAIEARKQELKDAEAELQQKEQQIAEIQAKYRGTTLTAEHNRIHTVAQGATTTPYQLAQNALNNAQTDYNNSKSANDDLEQKINDYEDATEKINTAQKQMDARQEAANKWDENNKNEYLELMGYWDFLQSGNTKSLFHISTKKLQDKMNNGEMNIMYTKWMQKHQYAA